jgi:redox-sensitive bicupin YhaK (pirin superfamily)
MEKKIDFILEGREKSIGEETVLQPLPHKDFRFASPFIVIHHLRPEIFAPHSPPVRVHPHPHRGFAPVTFLFQGEGFHRDSEGNEGLLKAGEVQWMFAGKGLLHSEGPSDALLKKGGTYEFVQLWVNVPAKHKMEKPYYQQASREEMPLLFDEPDVDIKLASGSFRNLEGPIQSFTPVTSAFGSIQKNKKVEFTAIEGYWTLLYVLEGSIQINDEKEITAHHLVIFSKQGSHFSITSTADTKLLYLSGEPIDEPVAAKGNIVMNTKEEIERAERDYTEGKFGSLDF